MTLGELQAYYSDFYKACHGFRPLFPVGISREWVMENIKILDNWFETMLSTPEGRETLRSEGWLV
jgi:hypothetical protein